MRDFFKIINDVSFFKFIFINLIIFFSAILEIIGISLFIPILATIQGEQSSLPKIFITISNYLRNINIELNFKNLLILLCVFFILKTILLLWSRYYSAKLAGDLIVKMRISLLGNWLNSSLLFTNKLKSGNLMSIIGEHAHKIGDIFFLLIQFITLLLTSILYFIFILLISWELTVALIIFSIIVIPILKYINEKAYFFSKSYLDSFENSQQFVMETLQGKKFLKATGFTKQRIDEYSGKNKLLVNAWVKVAFLSNSTHIILQPISVILLSILLLIYPLFGISLSLLAAFFVGFLRFVPVVQSCLSVFTAIKSSLPSLNRIENMLNDSKLSIEKSGLIEVIRIEEKISMKNISFRYDHNDDFVFKNLNLNINTNKLTGIKGPSGSGKSTLVDLLLGLYIVEKGTVKIDSTNINEINLNLFRKKVSYISQEPFLINDTIKNNILLGVDRIVSTKEINKVLHGVGATEFINRRGLDINSRIGDRGLELSGGQKQRLILARAILKKPILIILDEATSALDDYSEKQITQLVKELIIEYHLTAILISHKSNVLKISDEIYEIKNKKIMRVK